MRWKAQPVRCSARISLSDSRQPPSVPPEPPSRQTHSLWSPVPSSTTAQLPATAHSVLTWVAGLRHGCIWLQHGCSMAAAWTRVATTWARPTPTW